MCTINTTKFPNALCNDGTPGLFQLQMSATTSSVWVIWLAGGYDCTSASSCAERATNPKTKALTTSNNTPARAGQGILSHDPNQNPQLANANTVIIHYCTNDIWSGAYRARAGSVFTPTDTSTWNFEGRAIVKSTIQTLKALGVGFGPRVQVLLGGTSAGAYGAAVTANDVLPMLPFDGQLSLVLDAGFTLDLGPYNASLPAPHVDTSVPTPFYTDVGAGIPLWNGRGDFNCNDSATTLQQQVNCYNTSMLLQGGDLAMPTFVAESQIDSAELPAELCPQKNGKCSVPHNALTSQGQYVTYYGQQMATLLADGGQALPYTAFAPDQYIHAMLDSDSAFIQQFPLGSGTMAPRDAFNAWYVNRTPPGQLLLGTGPGIQ